MYTKDITDHRFVRLLALFWVRNAKGGQSIWKFKCDCGIEKEINAANVVYGRILSCGCLGRENRRKATLKHGMSGSREFMIWKGAKNRCFNKHGEDYHYYGGRGITMCARWSSSFSNFISDMGICPSKEHTLERRDNNGNYEPSNCKWATRLEQSNNTRQNRILTLDGQAKTISQWARELGLSYKNISRRLRRGWSVARALQVSLDVPTNTT